MVEINEEIIEKLKCSRCKAYLSCAPVLLKLDGQNICGRCSIQDEGTLTTRNLVYEEIASQVIFPCRYRLEGCNKMLQWNHVMKHEEKCDFRTYDCPSLPSGSCKWTGSNSQLLDHYKDNHPQLLLDHPCSLAPDLSQDGEENFLMTVFGFLFLVQIKLNTTIGKLWCCIRYLGNPAYISNFEFSLEVKNVQALMKKTKKVSPREGLLMTRSNCIEVNIKTLVDFLGENDNILFKLFVHKKGNICFKCQRDIRPLKLFCLGDSFHCENCRGDFHKPIWESSQFKIIKN